MIRNSADLLEKFIDEERKHVQKQKMPHMPTLGNAYEKITQCGLSEKFVLPENIDLKIVSGFIKIGEELIPNQIDCMLVTGSGSRYGLTDNYIYDIENILVIFEVKKTLNKNDLIDAYEHLLYIKKKSYNYFHNVLFDKIPDAHDQKIFENISSMLEKVCHEKGLDAERLLLLNQLIEKNTPIYIIHGYDGYSTESGLRRAYLDYLKNSINKEGYGIMSFPNLITSGEFSLTKLNGYPYLIFEDSHWVPIASCNKNLCWIMLELIWEKISIHFNISLEYNDDNLDMEGFYPLIKAKIIKKGDSLGWVYSPYKITDTKLKQFREKNNEWEPTLIGDAQLAILRRISMLKEEFSPSLEDYKYFEKTYFKSLKDIIKELVDSHLFRFENGTLYPIRRTTFIAETSDEKAWAYIAGDKQKFRLWLEKKKIKELLIHMILVSR